MANVTPYDPGAMPNRVVGTPGIDPSAGKAAAALSQGADQVRNGEANLANQAVGTLGQILGLGLHAVGAKIGSDIQKGRIARQQQQQQLADLGVVADGHQYEQDLHSTLNDYRTQHRNDPENLPDAMQKYVDDSKESRLKKYDDPVLRAKAEARFDEAAKTVMNKASDDSLDMQHSQAAAMAPNMVTAATTSIGQQTGPLEDRFQNFDDQVSIMAKGVAGMEPQLTKPVVQKVLTAGMRDASSELMSNVINERPENPIQALPQLAKAKDMLSGSVTMTKFLTGDDRHKFASQIEAAENQEVTQLDNLEVSTQLDNSLKIAKARFDLDAHRNDPGPQQTAIDWSVQQAAEANKQIAQINSMNLPEKAKIVAKRGLESRVKELDGLVKTAHANQRYQDAVRNGNAVEARRLQADQRREAADAKRAAAAELKGNRTEAQAELADKRLRLREAMADPVGNRQDIIKLGAEITDYTHKMREAGYLLPGEAFRGASEASRVVQSAAMYKPGFFGTGFMGSVDKLGNGTKQGEAIKRRSDYETDMQKQVAALEASDKIGALMQDMTPAQQKQFSEAASKIQDNAEKAGAKQWQIDAKMTQLKAVVMQSVEPQAKKK